jgi:penicillin-binding protein 2
MFLPDSEDPRLKATFTRRGVLMGIGQVTLLGGLGARLHTLQVGETERYRGLAESNRTTVYQTPPERGRIFDRFGTVLADNAATQRLLIVPHLARDVAQVLVGLHRILAMGDDAAERILLLARKQNPRIPILIASGLTWEQVARINLMAPELPGLQTETGYERRYFHGADMGHIVGHIGAPDKQTLEEEAVLRIPGMRMGRAGVELGLEKRLRGEAGHIKLQIEGRNRTIRQLEEVPAQAGRDAVLTIDLAMQRRAIALLSKERRAALVALDAQTGDVIAMASQPGFDNTKLAGAIAEREWTAFQRAADDPMTNRAIRGLYPPGSTFKMVTALAGLETGEITPTSKLECWGSFSFQDQHYSCWRKSGHGIVNLHRALKESCDCYFYEVARRVGIERLARMARQLGYGHVFDCGLALQKAGVVPDNDWKVATLGKRWYPGETILVGIGQGYLTVTPLQMAVMTARIASGRLIVPNLLRPDANDQSFETAPLPVAPSSLDVIRRGMIGAVNEDGGTAASAYLDLGNVLMAGKTGTAQVSSLSHSHKNEELPWHKRDHGLFVGFAPAKSPRYAVAAIVEHGSSGAKSAAPLVRQMMRDLLTSDPLARPAHVLGRDPGIPPVQTGLAQRG